MSESLDKVFDKPTKMTRRANHRLAGLKEEARRPHLATQADIPTGTNTRKRMEDAVADQAEHGDSGSAKTIQAGPKNSTNFGMKAEPPALHCRDNVLVDKGAAAPNPCHSLVEMRTLIPAGNLFPAGKASTLTRMIFYQPPL